jgi:hypothetical protein
MRTLGKTQVYITKDTGVLGDVYKVWVGQWVAGYIRQRWDAFRVEYRYDVDLYEAEKLNIETFDEARAYVADQLEVEP